MGGFGKLEPPQAGTLQGQPNPVNRGFLANAN
jgi:hypothetical protein